MTQERIIKCIESIDALLLKQSEARSHLLRLRLTLRVSAACIEHGIDQESVVSYVKMRDFPMTPSLRLRADDIAGVRLKDGSTVRFKNLIAIHY